MNFENYTKEEIEELTSWAIRMVKFWGFSALMYIAVFYGSTLAMWIIGSLVVLKAIDFAKEQRVEVSDDKDNRH
ncbi:MAG: hypothetical protein IIZ94_12645 [Prevotella sp.]|jgi:hypothetical protein|nr:hypothetical protein [Prevotella sp.]